MLNKTVNDNEPIMDQRITNMDSMLLFMGNATMRTFEAPEVTKILSVCNTIWKSASETEIHGPISQFRNALLWCSAAHRLNECTWWLLIALYSIARSYVSRRDITSLWRARGAQEGKSEPNNPLLHGLNYGTSSHRFSVLENIQIRFHHHPKFYYLCMKGWNRLWATAIHPSVIAVKHSQPTNVIGFGVTAEERSETFSCWTQPTTTLCWHVVFHFSRPHKILNWNCIVSCAAEPYASRIASPCPCWLQ